VVNLADSVRFFYDAADEGPSPSTIQKNLFFIIASDNFSRTKSRLRRLNDDGPLHVPADALDRLPNYNQPYFDLQYDLLYDFYRRVASFSKDSPKGYQFYGLRDEAAKILDQNIDELADHKQEKLEELSQFLDFHTFTSQVNIPTYVHFASDDWVVPSGINGHSLKNKVEHELASGVALEAHGKFAFTQTPWGSHCGQSVSYSHPHFSQIYAASVINSYSVEERSEMFRDYSLLLEGFGADGLKTKIVTSGKPTSIAYHFRVLSYNNMTINLSIETKGSHVVDYQLVLPFENLARLDGDLIGPFNDIHADALTRWANSNLFIVDGEGNDIRVSRKPAKGLRWTGARQ
jgi:hypothetical protein